MVLAIVASSCNDGFESALLFAQGVKIGIGLGVSSVNFFQPLLGGQHFTHATFHGLANGFIGVKLRLLRQVPNPDARHGNGFTVNVLVDAGHDLEECRFARSIQAQHTDLGTRKKAERNVFQDLPLGWHDLADAVHGVDILGHGNDCFP